MLSRRSYDLSRGEDDIESGSNHRFNREYDRAPEVPATWARVFVKCRKQISWLEIADRNPSKIGCESSRIWRCAVGLVEGSCHADAFAPGDEAVVVGALAACDDDV